MGNRMYGSKLNSARVVLLVTWLFALSDGNQGKETGTRYNRGADCQFIYSSLKYVCSQGAGITVVPSPCCISEVRYLELVGNPLTSLRKREFSRRFSGLHGMDLRNNQISRIQHGAFSGLRRLQILDLSGNRLTTLPDGVFRGLSSLTTLRLGGNGMVGMSQGAFGGLPSLTVLRLDNNHLREIREEAFEPLERLRGLYLDGNQLSRLESESFSGLHRLQTLSMASNQLQTFPDILRKLPELIELILSSNPIVCDCRILFLHRWFAQHGNGQSRDTVRCSSPPQVRGQRLRSISPQSLCQTQHNTPNTNGGGTSEVLYDQSFSSSTSVTYQDQSFPSAGEASSHSVTIDVYLDGNPTPRPTTEAATAGNGKSDQVFFDDIPGSDQAIPPPPTTSNNGPGVPLDPGQRPPRATDTPLVTIPTFDPGRPEVVTSNLRPVLPPNVPDGRPAGDNPNPAGPVPSGPRPPGKPAAGDPLGPTSGHGWTVPGYHPGRPDQSGNSEQPTIVPGGPSVHTNGSSIPNDTVINIPSDGATGFPDQPNNDPNNRPGPGLPNDSEIVITPTIVTGNPSVLTEPPVAEGPSGEAGTAGGGSSGAGSPNSPLVIYGVDGQSVVLHCGTEELETRPRVKWLQPNGRPVIGLNSRFKLKKDGSLRIHPLRRGDTGSYRCIVRTTASSRVILVRLRSACPCTDAASFEDYLYEDSSPEPYPVPSYACSWTPLVIAVVTTFQGTIVACALAFCVWYTRCHRRKTFTVRVEEAERRDSKRLRNSDMSVLRQCSNSTITSLNDSSRPTSYEQGSLQPCDSSNAVSLRTNNTLSDYMNAYVTQQMRRQYQLRLPVPDYVDLDPNSRDRHETLYSSLRGRDFSNRRRRIVTQ